MKTLKHVSLLVVVLILVLTGCNNSAPTDSTANAVTVNDTETQVDQEETNTEDVAKEDEEIVETPLTALEKAEEAGSYEVMEVIELDSVKNNNKVNDPGTRAHLVFLPPSYYESEKSYPVVYYFHGFGSNPIEIRAHQSQAFENMQNGDLKEMIIVGINCGDTFLANSPVLGNWEDGFINEIIPYIDATYRTIPTREGRSATGFSMGGYISSNIALNHPDLFCAVYAMGPGMLIDEEIDIAMGSWSDGFKEAYGSAFAPTEEGDILYEMPTLDGSDADQEIIDRWMNGFGHIEEKIDAYNAGAEKLDGFGLEFADNDMFPWITTGAQRFSDYMTEVGIEHTTVINQNGHTLTTAMYADNALPFLADYME